MISEETRAQMRAVVARYPQARSAMLSCLHIAQDAEGMVTEDGIAAVAEAIGAKRDEVESIATFYSMYHFEPQGRAVVKVCTSIACYLMGCDPLLRQLEDGLGVTKGETSADGNFTLEGVECLAACGMAPALQVNGEFVERVGAERAKELIRRLRAGESLDGLISSWKLTTTGGYNAAATTDEVAQDEAIHAANATATVPADTLGTTQNGASGGKNAANSKNAPKNSSQGGGR